MSIFSKRPSPAQVANTKRDTFAELKAKEEAAEIKLAELQERRVALSLAAVTAGPGSAEAKAYEQARKDEAAQRDVVAQYRDARAQAQKEADEAERRARSIEQLKRLGKTDKLREENASDYADIVKHLAEAVSVCQRLLRRAPKFDFGGNPRPVGALLTSNEIIAALQHELHRLSGPTFGPDALPPFPGAKWPDISKQHDPAAVRPLSEVAADADRIIRERLQLERSKLEEV